MSDKEINEFELKTFIEIILEVFGDNPLYTKDYLTNLAKTDPRSMRALASDATTAAEGGGDGGEETPEAARARAQGPQPEIVPPSSTTDGIKITDVLGMQSAAPGQGPGGSTDYTVGDFGKELAAMRPEERERLAQALYLEGYYGTISDISEIMDPTRFSNAMLASLRHGVTAFSGVAKTAEGMEAVPTLEGRFKDFSEEEFEQAKNALLKKFSPATKSVAELKEIIDEVATSQARRGLTTEETQIVLVAVQAAAKMSAASPLNEGFNYQRAAGEAVTEAIGPVEAGAVELEDYWDNYASQALGLG